MPKNTAQLKIWIGKFGKKYTERTKLSFRQMEEFYKNRYSMTKSELNKIFLDKFDRSGRILEIGANIGNQLLCLRKMGFKNLYGIEPQNDAIRLSKKRTGNINIIKGNVFDIPFKDNFFELVFTSGVLIHISPDDIEKAMKEIYRVTRTYIWGFEYYGDEYEEIIYRGKKNLLWKANFSELYLGLFNNLELVKEKKLKHLDSENIDTVFLLKKTNKR